MAIDRSEVQAMWDSQKLELARDNAASSRIQYRTVEMSVAWKELLGWIREQELMAQAAMSHADRLMHEGSDYSHAALSQQKALIDIRHAELNMLNLVLGKIQSFHEEQGETP